MPDRAARASTDRTIGSIGRTMSLLMGMASRTDPIRVTDLARELELDKSVVSRHLSTLAKEGFVEKPDGGDGYILGRQLIILGEAARAQNPPFRVSRPYLKQLRDEVSTAVLFCVPGAVHPGVTVMHALSAPRTYYGVPLGSYLAPPDSPSACVRLAYADAAMLDRFMATGQQHKSLNSEAKRKKFLSRLTTIRKQGYDLSLDPHATGIAGAAAPVFDVENELVGTVTIVTPSISIQPGAEQTFIERIVSCARRISESIGHKP